MKQNLTLKQLEERLDWVENLIATEKDPKNLPYHNSLYQSILDELARRDVEQGESVDDPPRSIKLKRV